MKITAASFQILDFPDDAIEKICIAARTCYQSEPKGEKSNENLVKRLIKLEHFTPLEHCTATVRIICDRGVLAELTRHRLASFNVESTRYVNYDKKGMVFIKPSFWKEGSRHYKTWLDAMTIAETYYKYLIDKGAKPEQARSVLPMSLKTEIVMSCNFREWMHILKLRCSPAAHPDMRALVIPLRDEFRRRCPAVFGKQDTF